MTTEQIANYAAIAIVSIATERGIKINAANLPTLKDLIADWLDKQSEKSQ